jgi:hypothetical protein
VRDDYEEVRDDYEEVRDDSRRVGMIMGESGCPFWTDGLRLILQSIRNLYYFIRISQKRSKYCTNSLVSILAQEWIR